MKKKSLICLSLLIFTIAFIGNIGYIFADDAKSKTLDVKLTETDIKLIPDVVYSQIFGRSKESLKMDILKPLTNKKYPAVVFVTGGGFVSAPKENNIKQRMDMAEAGYVVASIEYRVVPNATFPAPLEDVKSAIRYLKANAETFGIDPNHIAVMGESAGGYLAAITGTTNGLKKFDKGDNLDQNSKVQAVVDLYGLSDLTKIGDDFSKEVQEAHNSPSAPEAMLVNGISIFGKSGSINDNPEAAKAANPITYISKDTSPFLIMHGDKDMVVSPSQTEILHDALVKKGINSTRYVVKNAEHAKDYWAQPEVMDVIIKFLDKHLKK